MLTLQQRYQGELFTLISSLQGYCLVIAVFNIAVYNRVLIVHMMRQISEVPRIHPIPQCIPHLLPRMWGIFLKFTSFWSILSYYF